jgi:hypothetical protein
MVTLTHTIYDSLMNTAEVLKSIEWSVEEYYCPACGCGKDTGHSIDCALRAALDKLEKCR